MITSATSPLSNLSNTNPTSNTEMHLKTLYQAVIDENIDLVRLLLLDGVPVDMQDSAGNFLLHYASQQGTQEIVRLLLKFGAKVDAQNPKGQSALHFVAKTTMGTTATINILLEEGASVDIQDTDGNTPLHLTLDVVRADLSSHVSQLLDAGASPNLTNNAGLTAFHVLLDLDTYGSPCKENVRCLISKFLDRGASTSLRFPSGKTPLGFFLFRNADLGSSQAHAIPFEDARVCETIGSFLSKGARVDTPGPTGISLSLIVAYLWHSRFPDINLGKKLCELVNPDQVFHNGNTALHLLIANTDFRAHFTCGDVRNHAPFQLLDILLQRGANPNHRNDAGKTPLMRLFEIEPRLHWNGSEVAVGILLAHGADPSQPDLEGFSVTLRVAMLRGYERAGTEELRRLLNFCIPIIRARSSQPEALTTRAEVLWWREWEQAVRQNDWDQVEPLLKRHSAQKQGDIDRRFVALAYATLAECHLQVYEDELGNVSEGAKPDKPGVRTKMARVLRDCRKYKAPVDKKYLDLVLRLCC